MLLEVDTAVAPLIDSNLMTVSGFWRFTLSAKMFAASWLSHSQKHMSDCNIDWGPDTAISKTTTKGHCVVRPLNRAPGIIRLFYFPFDFVFSLDGHFWICHQCVSEAHGLQLYQIYCQNRLAPVCAQRSSFRQRGRLSVAEDDQETRMCLMCQWYYWGNREWRFVCWLWRAAIHLRCHFVDRCILGVRSLGIVFCLSMDTS